MSAAVKNSDIRMKGATALLLTALVVAVLAGCGGNGHTQSSSETPSSHNNVTTLDMKPGPMTVSPAITSQRQAQEALYGYMQKTLQGLPDNIFLDNKRYGGYGAGTTAACDSERVDRENSPVDFADSRDMHTPPGTGYNDLIAKVGDIWKSWGWKVEERDSDDKPNRYGHSPDGYRLIIAARPEQFANYPPRFTGSTPCFPASLRDDAVPQPRVISKDELLYDEPSATPT